MQTRIYIQRFRVKFSQHQEPWALLHSVLDEEKRPVPKTRCPTLFTKSPSEYSQRNEKFREIFTKKFKPCGDFKDPSEADKHFCQSLQELDAQAEVSRLESEDYVLCILTAFFSWHREYLTHVPTLATRMQLVDPFMCLGLPRVDLKLFFMRAIDPVKRVRKLTQTLKKLSINPKDDDYTLYCQDVVEIIPYLKNEQEVMQVQHAVLEQWHRLQIPASVKARQHMWQARVDFDAVLEYALIMIALVIKHSQAAPKEALFRALEKVHLFDRGSLTWTEFKFAILSKAERYLEILEHALAVLSPSDKQKIIDYYRIEFRSYYYVIDDQRSAISAELKYLQWICVLIGDPVHNLWPNISITFYADMLHNKFKLSEGWDICVIDHIRTAMLTAAQSGAIVSKLIDMFPLWINEPERIHLRAASYIITRLYFYCSDDVKQAVQDKLFAPEYFTQGNLAHLDLLKELNPERQFQICRGFVAYAHHEPAHEDYYHSGDRAIEAFLLKLYSPRLACFQVQQDEANEMRQHMQGVLPPPVAGIVASYVCYRP